LIFPQGIIVKEGNITLMASGGNTILTRWFSWQLDSVVSPSPFHRPRAVLSLNIGGVESGESRTFVSDIYFVIFLVFLIL